MVMKYTQIICVIVWFMSLQIFSSDDLTENTGLGDYAKINDKVEKEELIEVMKANDEEKNHNQLSLASPDKESTLNNANEIFGRKRPNSRRELLYTMIEILKKFCGSGSRIIFDLLFKFLDAPMPENGIINTQVGMTIQLSSDYHWLVTAGLEDEGEFIFTIKIWSMKDGSLKHNLEPSAGHFRVRTCLFTSNNQKLITADINYVRVWSVTTGALIHTFPPCAPHIVILSPDGKYVLWHQYAGELVYMWSLETFTNVGTFHGHSVTRGVGIRWMKFRNFNQELITSKDDYTIQIWNVATQTCKQTLAGHSNIIPSCKLSQNQQFLVSGSWDMTAKIWHIDTGKDIQTFGGHTNRIDTCSFVNDDKWVTSMDSGGTMYLWRVEDGSIVHNFSNIHSWPGMARFNHNNQSYWVNIEPSENLLLVSKSSPMDLQVVDVKSGRATFTLNGHQEEIINTMIIDGRIVLSQSCDGKIRFCNLAKEKPNYDNQHENKE